MERIIIIGCPGSGKTTLAKQLSNILNLPLIHLDKLGWRGNWELTPKEELDKLILNELKNPKWIIDGNYNRTIPLRLSYCDTVIYFDFPTIKCVYGVLKRVISNYGKTRTDMGGNCPDRLDLTFLKFVIDFKRKHRKRHYEMLEDKKNIKVITLKNRKQVLDFLININSKDIKLHSRGI